MFNIGMVSLGCPKNLVDTENILGNLKEHGVNIVTNPKDAEVIIINTCGFIESAKQEAIDTIIEMSKYKEIGKCKKLIVIGCLAQRYKKEIYEEMPEVDRVFGLKEYDKLLEEIINENCKFSCEYRLLSTPPYMAYLRISDGCDNRCAYCAIPMIRGKHISRRKEEIINEAKKLANDGVKELVIIAQDTTRYGIDLYGTYELANLLKELCKIDGIRWIRILYAYPELVSDELIDTISNEEKVCNYIDIPLQHISDKVLKSMNRRASKKDIYSLIDKLKNKVPNITLRTSLMVGFPGETEDDYNELLEFVKYAKFDRLGVFEYSKEENTKAFDMDNQLSDSVKKERASKILEIQQQISKENNSKFIGKRLLVLIEKKAKNSFYLSRSYRDSMEIDGLVYVKSNKDLNIGEFYEVLITDVKEYDLYGTII